MDVQTLENASNDVLNLVLAKLNPKEARNLFAASKKIKKEFDTEEFWLQKSKQYNKEELSSTKERCLQKWNQIQKQKEEIQKLRNNVFTTIENLKTASKNQKVEVDDFFLDGHYYKVTKRDQSNNPTQWSIFERYYSPVPNVDSNWRELEHEFGNNDQFIITQHQTAIIKLRIALQNFIKKIVLNRPGILDFDQNKIEFSDFNFKYKSDSDLILKLDYINKGSSSRLRFLIHYEDKTNTIELKPDFKKDFCLKEYYSKIIYKLIKGGLFHKVFQVMNQ